MFHIVSVKQSGNIGNPCTSIAGSKLIDYVVLDGLLLMGLIRHMEEDVARLLLWLDLHNLNFLAGICK